MRIRGRGVALALLLAAVLEAGVAFADNNPNGTVFRAVGWFKGRESVSETTITCEIPTVSSAIHDGLFALGLWNTYGAETLFFPDRNNGLANPCGAYIQMHNNLIGQALQVDRVEVRYKIPGARRFRQFVPSRNQFPIACREFRRDTLFVGAVINPIDSTIDQSGSGSPNVAFVQMLPLVTPQMIHCLRAQYAPLPTTLFVSLPLVIRATVFATSDSGDVFRANTIGYALNLRHTCGNGRVDDGEQCDPAAVVNTCAGTCTAGTCTQAVSKVAASGLQRSSLHGSPSLQSRCRPPTHMPAPSQMSLTVQGLPSSHGVL